LASCQMPICTRFCTFLPANPLESGTCKTAFSAGDKTALLNAASVLLF